MHCLARIATTVGLGLLAACSDSTGSEEDTPPLANADVEGIYKISMSLSTPSLHCEWTNVTVAMAALDSANLRVDFGGGQGICDGHGLGDADTLTFAVQQLATTLRTNDRIRMVWDAAADTLDGSFSGDRQTITGRAVLRGTLATDNYDFTLRGTWTAVREDAP